MFSNGRHSAIGLTVVLALAPVAAAFAQAQGAGREGVRVFEPDYYAEYDPVSALDLVFRTPGFNPQERDGGRGLSRVRSNILIDGERPPPKGRSLRQQLRELPVYGVERIELIDAGARLDLDMQGYPQVVNVVTVTDPPAYYEVAASVRRDGTGDRRQENERNYGVRAAGSFNWRAHEFTLRGNLEDSGSRSPSGFVSIDPANPEQRVTATNLSDEVEERVELGAVFELPSDSSLTFNGRLSWEDESSSPFEFGAGGGLDAVGETFVDEEEEQDLAVEYRRPLGEEGRLMVAFVDATATERSEESLTDGGLSRASFEDSEEGETAYRLMVTRTPTDDLTLRFTATSAFNFFDGGFRLFENGVELPVEGSANRVEEDRRSVEGAVDWNLSDRWTLRAALGFEGYEIRSLDVSSGLQRDPKGEFSIAFRPRPRTTWSLESTRRIGQLSFGQFLASSSLSSEILTAGASSLKPEYTWTHTASYDKRFGDVGVMRFALSREKVDNPVRAVALSDSLIVAQNSASQTIDEARATVEFPFEPFGREDLILSTDLRLAQSETVDPITGEVREVSEFTSREWSLGLRRDPGDGKLAWGASMTREFEGDDYSVRQIRESSFSHEWEAYVEWELVDDVKLGARLEGPSTSNWRSSFFDTVRRRGLDPSFVSETLRSEDRSASISVEWRRLDNVEIVGSLSTRPAVRDEESLTPFGETAGPFSATETATTPRAQVRVRFYR